RPLAKVLGAEQHGAGRNRDDDLIRGPLGALFASDAAGDLVEDRRLAYVGWPQQEDTAPGLQRLEDLGDLRLAAIGAGELPLLRPRHQIGRAHVDQPFDSFVHISGFAHSGMPFPPPPHWRVACSRAPLTQSAPLVVYSSTRDVASG